MNSGHSMMSVAAMLLLSITILGVNSKILRTNDVLNDTKFAVLAVSLGTSVIEEASGKPFDLAVSGDAITDINQLTAPTGLGPAGGEVYPNFNDFDDFNGFTKIVTKMPSADTFKIACKVKYVTDGNPALVSTVRTWHKRIDVSVYSNNMFKAEDTIRLSSVYSYWYFR
jgi:hypothetical protein